MQDGEVGCAVIWNAQASVNRKGSSSNTLLATCGTATQPACKPQQVTVPHNTTFTIYCCSSHRMRVAGPKLQQLLHVL
jgi:hypothetical protein